jgi:hypothetical protein
MQELNDMNKFDVQKKSSEEQDTSKLLQQYQNIVKQLMAANKKNTIEFFLQHLEFEE